MRIRVLSPDPKRRPLALLTGLCLSGFLLLFAAAAADLPSFDFTQATGRADWTAAHDISALETTADGLGIRIGGEDPYLVGPPRDYPTGTRLWLRLRLKSAQGGLCQVFYFRDTPTEPNSVRVPVPAGDWFETKVMVPALGPGYRLRIDPPGNGGVCVLSALRFEEVSEFRPPTWPKPRPPAIKPTDRSVTSGGLKLVHGGGGLGAFTLSVNGHLVAMGNDQPMLGYLIGKQARWVALGAGSSANTSISETHDGVSAQAATDDPEGGHWRIQQTFAAGKEPGTIDVTTRVSVNQNRSVIYLPWFTLLAGCGGFGTNKTQAMLAGVEYLENEPSSSEADVEGPGSHRQVPDTLKITFPLMAVVAEGSYIGLTWRPQTNVAAAFDSPDRIFASGGHLMGLLFPGSDALNRDPSSLLPYDGAPLHPGDMLVFSATILGGAGTNVVPAVQQYARLHDWPPLPGVATASSFFQLGSSANPVITAPTFFKLMAHGWLDSKIRENDLFRHAAPNFGLGPSSDAALYMDWLAQRIIEPELVTRLTEAAAAALAKVPAGNLNAAQLGHVHYPLPALVYGGVAENAAAARAHGRALLDRFAPDGTVHFQKSANGLDYARTHWAPDANGLTGQIVETILEAAAFSGDQTLIADGLAKLRGMDRYRGTVPRGAQTWEVPLHTPDILASAYLVRAYTLGYELSGERDFLEQAQYWAWTGVPFVYLTPPTPQPVGVYSTIPVLGATSWVAPLWIGLPVQWCGLVYADSLYWLARYTPRDPWKTIADGIVASGVQQTYPLTDSAYQGLLPDSYNLRTQTRNGPAINPATLLAPATRYWHQPVLYDYQVLRQHGMIVHAPGAIVNAAETGDSVSFEIQGWPKKPYWVLVNGVASVPSLKINGRSVNLEAPHVFQPDTHWLILQLEGKAKVELKL